MYKSVYASSSKSIYYMLACMRNIIFSTVLCFSCNKSQPTGMAEKNLSCQTHANSGSVCGEATGSSDTDSSGALDHSIPSQVVVTNVATTSSAYNSFSLSEINSVARRAVSVTQNQVDQPDERLQSAEVQSANQVRIRELEERLAESRAAAQQERMRNNELGRLLTKSRAATQQAVREIVQLVGTGINTDMPLLHAAARNGNHVVCQIILDRCVHETARQAALTQRDHCGRTPLMWAAYNSHALVGVGDSQGEGGTATCRILLASFSNVLDKRDEITKQANDGWTALMHAACNGNTESCRLLLNQLGTQGNKRIALQQMNNVGKTPLMLAREYGHHTTHQVLLESLFANVESQLAFDPAVSFFGGQAWARYFDTIVADVPALPHDIHAILTSPCPFWKHRRVYETHLLGLIPASIGRRPFSLNLLGGLIQTPQSSGHKTQYSYYTSKVREQIGESSPDRAYWILLTRDVLPSSRAKTYAKQKKMITRYACQGYALPTVLEAVTAILMHHVRTGERLFSDAPLTFMRCQDLIDDVRYSSVPTAIGGFSDRGLGISYDGLGINSSSGVSCCRKL